MRIQTKIQWYSSLFLIAMLLLLGLLVAIMFFWISLDREKDVLEEQVSLFVQNNPIPQIAVEHPEILEPYTPEDGMLRILSPEGQVINVYSDEEDYREMEIELMGEEGFSIKTVSGDFILLYQNPINSSGEGVGVVEIVHSLEDLWENTLLLLYVLAGASLVIILFSILAGKWLSRLILKPIALMSRTMGEIEESGRFQTIIFEKESKDELQQMGLVFNKMIQRLKENQYKQQQFVSDASHELKTPITVIESYANLLKRRDISDPKMQKQAAESIHHEALRMKRLTSQLLDIAALDEQDILPNEQLEIVGFCEKIAHIFTETKNRFVHVDSIKKEIIAFTNREKIEQVIIILLDNAIKYSKGDVAIYIDQNDKGPIMISVEDEGIGIPKKDLPYVFDRFYRVDSSRSRETGGSGLGLSIARELLHSLGGKISITSEENKGTSVKVTL
ncbi:HAMP domain-containing sensor histidine kinase [Ureibacillus aquaedulcis]|uniref:Signal transduction histidine-protein kinase ArlS n=1 Tax=Ureibacillus aquaedulcis TaxID=3058421 RepID=A0ABT8GUZ9_9BACL|nr:HAMP domain-containing histidine kinase [Ureibacillus sp. BA0131]MDN4495240.1 HAMP domain-containing histidine kinase [Ureibacillus sp. BA0131]